MADKQELFSLTPTNVGRIYFHVKGSNKYIGYAYMEVDGYYVFVFSEPCDGSWSDYALLEIGMKLKELNKEWDEKVKSEFSSKK